jgi:GTP cyclohydrolase II
MTLPLVPPETAAAPPPAVVAVDRAIAEFRRGDVVFLSGATGEAALVQAAEGASAGGFARMRAEGAELLLAVTGRRAAALGQKSDGEVAVLALPAEVRAGEVRALADPSATGTGIAGLSAAEPAAEGLAAAAVDLARLARLLPAVVLAPLPDPVERAARAEGDALFAHRRGLLVVRIDDIAQYRLKAARTLTPVGEARVPLAGAEDARIVAFRPSDGGIEHLAIIIGDPPQDQPVLTRLHSECFTGDLLGSLRCDCGDQLRGAIDQIGRAGAGVLLYLSQEGRGIGLVNKLRAYRLQDRGADTVEANEQLGFDADERVYLPAAEMLRRLGFGLVRLLTNNPGKVTALERCGIRVVERVPHIFPSNDHNADYLRTKAARFGHLF